MSMVPVRCQPARELGTLLGQCSKTWDNALLAAFECTGLPLHAHLPAVAQGLVPREQNIGRAEICALLQVCCLAEREPNVRYRVYSDSEYVLGFLGRLHLPATQRWQMADWDLCEWSDVWRCPDNLTFVKVSSHQDLAISAAKAARRQDFPFLQSLLEVEVCHKVHEDMLHSFLL